jgi:hypothetical protein
MKSAEDDKARKEKIPENWRMLEKESCWRHSHRGVVTTMLYMVDRRGSISFEEM